MLSLVLTTVIVAGFNNPSFERNIVATDTWAYTVGGWQVSGDAGTWSPNGSAYTSQGYSGNNVGFVQTGWALPQGILSTWIKLDDATTYSFDYLRATRLDNPLNFDSYNFNIYNTNNTLVYGQTRYVNTPGVWAPQYHIFSTSGTNDNLYRDYRVEFLVNNCGQLNIDNVSFRELIPSPGTLVLAVGSMLFIRRTRNGIRGSY